MRLDQTAGVLHPTVTCRSTRQPRHFGKGSVNAPGFDHPLCPGKPVCRVGRRRACLSHDNQAGKTVLDAFTPALVWPGVDQLGADIGQFILQPIQRHRLARSRDDDADGKWLATAKLLLQRAFDITKGKSPIDRAACGKSDQQTFRAG